MIGRDHAIDYQPGELTRLVQFLIEARKPENLSRYPSCVDLEELLTLPDVCEQTRLWLDVNKNIIGYAIVDPRNCNLWFESDPQMESSSLEEGMVAWGIRRFNGLKRRGVIRADVTLDTNCEEQNRVRSDLLKASGFIPQKLLTLRFERCLSEPIPPVKLPPGYSIRPVSGEDEIDELVSLYHAAYGTERMTGEELSAIMHTSTYERELNLVAVSPQKRIVGVCTCWMDKRLNQQLPRKEGWTDPVLVHPDHQGMGLSRALIHYGWGLLKSRDIEVAMLGTSSENGKAIAAFMRAGYKIKSRSCWFSLQV